MLVSLNQCRGKTGSFYKSLNRQITELIISLLNVLVNFTYNVSFYIIFIEDRILLTHF